MRNKDILFTFDYELFLGERSGSVQKCMLEPTEKLIALFEKYNIRNAIFFVDTTYLIRLKELAKSNSSALTDYTAITFQLQKLIRHHHYVFPHIHPHWLDASYDAGSSQWKLSDISKYRFHSISNDERENLFSKSFDILKEIIYPINFHYAIDGYRAGGWCIQPFADFYPQFKKHEIRFDFSVLRGLKNFSSAQYFDFEKVPLKNIYRFENDVLVDEKYGSLTQISISTIPFSKTTELLNKFLLKFLWKTGNRSIGDGSGVVANKISENKNVEQSVSATNLEMVSIELLNAIKLPHYKNYLEQNKYMHFISHPKMLSNHNFKSFEKFLKFVRTNFDLTTDFREMKE